MSERKVAGAWRWPAARRLLTAWRRRPAPQVSGSSEHGVTRNGRWLAALGLMLASGFAGLGYQIVWTQQSALWLGHESAAVLAVITAFFGGLGVGAWTLGSRIERSDRPVRWYASCEAVIASWSLLLAFTMSPWSALLLQLIGPTPTALWQWTIAFCGTFVLLLPATAAMGATLPAMSRLAVRERAIAPLYASNTLGAVIGVLAIAFWLIPTCGLIRTTAVCVALNIACAVISLRVFLPAVASTRAASPARASVAPLALTGFLGIGFEVAVVRVLSQVAEDTVYTFALLLAVYLLGTSLGAAGFDRWLSKWDPDKRGTWLFTATSVACLAGAGTLWAAEITKDAVLVWMGPTLASALTAEAVMAFAAFALPTVAMGALFSHLTTREGVSLGRALGANTLGAAAAPVIFGVGLLPAMGSKPTLLLIAVAYLLLLARQPRSPSIPVSVAPASVPPPPAPAWASATSTSAAPTSAAWAPASASASTPAVAPSSASGSASASVSTPASAPASASASAPAPTSAWAPIAVALASAAALAIWAPPLVFIDVPEGAHVVSYHEGVMAAVSVVEDADGVSRLRINNRQQEGSSATLRVDARQAWLPLLLHPAPHRALFLGLGTGVTAASATDDPTLTVDAVELLPEVIDASSHFADVSRLHVVAADARRYVRTSDQHYDVIVSDNFHPARSGSGSLYTVEHFEAVRARLSPHGVFCQWLPLHQLDLPTLRSIVRSFLAVYPGGWVMLASNSLETPVLGLVGSADNRHFDVSELSARLAGGALPPRLANIGIEDEFALLGSFVAGPASLARFAGSADLNTDDRPVVAYRAPRVTYSPDSLPRDRLTALLNEWSIEPPELVLPATDAVWMDRLSAYGSARNLFIAIGRDVRPSGDVRQMLAQVREPLLSVLRTSPDFRPAYDPLVRMAGALAQTDLPAARLLLTELNHLQPARPEAAASLLQLGTP